MAEVASDSVILKILVGMQAGVEVALVPGEYVLGTGPEDDIQLIDVSIRPGHARLRVSGGKIALAGAAGALRTAAGLQIESGSGFQEIEPLDVVTAGTTRFALGHPTSQWATVLEDDAAPTAGRPAAPLSGGRLRALAMPLAALALLVGFALWLLMGGGLTRIAGTADAGRDDLVLTRAALDQFPFGRAIAARQEVDGAVYVSGYVDTPVERRALVGAVEKTGIPARIRLWVLQTIRAEIESLIAAQKLPVGFQLSEDGTLVLDGLILNEGRAARFVDLVKDRVVGLAAVQSRIRTAQSLLGEVERLAQAAQIQPYVLLRVVDDLIEATGAIPAEKVDAFVGFLQSYARRFAREIPLRSFVQLQGAGTPGAERAILVGGTASGGEVALDPDQLAQGIYRPGEILPGAGNRGGVGPLRPGGRPQTVLADAAGEGGMAGRNGTSGTSGTSGANGRDGQGASEAAGTAGSAATRAGEAEGSAARPAADGVGDRTRDLFRRWREDRLGGDSKSRALKEALDGLRASDPAAKPGAAPPGWYLPVLAEDGAAEGDPCWADTRLRPRDVVAALVWLDLLSTNEAVSLTDQERPLQLQLLEVALNPARAAACARRAPEGERAAARSVYLREIGRNPAFVRFITRDLPPFGLDLTGASLVPARYVLTRGGRKLHEGAAPDQTSRVASIGELGVALQLKAGLAAVVFDPDLSWKIMP